MKLDDSYDKEISIGYLGNNGCIGIPTIVETEVNEKIAIVACDEDSVWILPYKEIENKIDKIKEMINTNGYTKEFLENMVDSELRKLYNSILCITTITEWGTFKASTILASLLEDNTVFFRNVKGNLKMYFGKEAFKKSFKTHSYVR